MRRPGDPSDKKIVIRGKKIAVPDPATLRVPPPVPAPYDSASTHGRPVGEMTPPEATVEPPSDTKGPLVEFGRLADQRLQELHAYETAGQLSADVVVQGDDGKYIKVYTRFPLRGLHISITRQDPLELEAEIVYDHVVFVQSAESKEALVRDRGEPHKETPPVTVTETYKYEDGEWTYVEKP